MKVYTKQQKYLNKMLRVCKRVSLLVPKSRESEIKAIAKQMRENEPTKED